MKQAPKLIFETSKPGRSAYDLPACDVLETPIVVCRASGTCVVPKDKQRKNV